mgnify:FL=1
MSRLYTRKEFVQVLISLLFLLFVLFSAIAIYLTISPELQFWLVAMALVVAFLTVRYIVGLSQKLIFSLESNMPPGQNAVYRTLLSACKTLLLMYLGFLVFTTLQERTAEVIVVYIVLFALYLRDTYSGAIRKSEGRS